MAIRLTNIHVGIKAMASTRQNGLKDIFIHRSALEVAGINDLNDNQSEDRI